MFSIFPVPPHIVSKAPITNIPDRMLEGLAQRKIGSASGFFTQAVNSQMCSMLIDYGTFFNTHRRFYTHTPQGVLQLCYF